jgi:hypothetical protein
MPPDPATPVEHLIRAIPAAAGAAGNCVHNGSAPAAAAADT